MSTRRPIISRRASGKPISSEVRINPSATDDELIRQSSAGNCHGPLTEADDRSDRVQCRFEVDVRLPRSQREKNRDDIDRKKRGRLKAATLKVSCKKRGGEEYRVKRP